MDIITPKAIRMAGYMPLIDAGSWAEILSIMRAARFDQTGKMTMKLI
jgi:hypothetical protein